MYWYQNLEKYFEVIEKIKISKFEGDLGDVFTKISLCIQFWTKYLEQNKDITQNWTEVENLKTASG